MPDPSTPGRRGSESASRPMTTDWMEAWCSGFNAARDGLSGDDAREFMAAMQAAFDRSGAEMARKVNEGVITESEARTAMGGAHA